LWSAANTEIGISATARIKVDFTTRFLVVLKFITPSKFFMRLFRFLEKQNCLTRPQFSGGHVVPGVLPGNQYLLTPQTGFGCELYCVLVAGGAFFL
jgi:hypothetical protein